MKIKLFLQHGIIRIEAFNVEHRSDGEGRYYCGNSFQTYHGHLTVICRLMENQNNTEGTIGDRGLKIDGVRLSAFFLTQESVSIGNKTDVRRLMSAGVFVCEQH